MTISRAPRGIPTGGQFVASTHSEPSVSLSPSTAGATPDLLENLTTDRDGNIRDRRTGQAIQDGVLTEDQKTNVFDPWEAGGVRRPAAPPTVTPRSRQLREDELEDLQDAVDASREPYPRRSLGFNYGKIVDWRTKSVVDYDDLSDEEKTDIRAKAQQLGVADPGRHRILKSAERLRDDIGDSVGETVDALGEAAGHFMDVQRGDVPAPEVEGTFVGWNQMLPKFMRRKNQN